MKRKYFKTFVLVGLVGVLGLFTSCEDYLTLYPTDSITGEDFWTTSNDVNNVRAAAYYQLTQCEGNILEWGELRSDNVTLNKMDKEAYRDLQEAVLVPSQPMFSWEKMYKGINLCNEVLENGQRMIDNNVDPSFTRNNWLSIKAEMTALRALYYFYLVRAYRNVPFVRKSVSTDAEAIAARIAVTPGHEILDSLIKEVQGVKIYANEAYGNVRDNKGRWTRMSMNALLADMMLWRACMVVGAKNKANLTGDSTLLVKNSNGNTLTASEETALASQLLEGTVAYCDTILQRLRAEYDERLLLNPFASEREKKQPYPLIQNEETTVFAAEDLPYAANFVRGNSTESLLELQHDATNNRNGTLSTYFYGNPDGGFVAGIMAANPVLFGQATGMDPAKGYGKTDMRFLSYGMYSQDSQSRTTPIIKGVATAVITSDRTDMLKGTTNLYVFLNNNANGTNWPVYRLTDIMLMKAEAIARLRSAKIGNQKADYSERVGYSLVDEIFARNNPGIDSTNTASTEYCKRFGNRLAEETKAWTQLTAAETETVMKKLKERHPQYPDLLSCVYAERQREFLGEGKRWFDLVRECEFRGETKDVLSDWMNAPTVVRNRLRTLWSLYNPIYTEELKVNGKKYGNKNGQLVQNEAWEIYMPKMQ